MQRSRRELGMLVLFLGIAVLSFSSLMYYAEMGPENKFFTSIPATFWWALITMTTVGCATPTPTPLETRRTLMKYSGSSG